MTLRAVARSAASASRSRSWSVRFWICARRSPAVAAIACSRAAIFSRAVVVVAFYVLGVGAVRQLGVIVPVRRRTMRRAEAQYTRETEERGSTVYSRTRYRS